jgi:hypothetical protein
MVRRCTVRQTRKGNIASGCNLSWCQIFDRQSQTAYKAWVHIGDHASISLPARSGNYLDLGMA